MTNKYRPKIRTLIVYGGSFDPVHLGHIQAVKIALQTLSPSSLFITPAFRNPFKSHITHSTHKRIKWLKRSIRSYIKDSRVKLCLFEIKRNAPTPTIHTIHYLKKTYNISKIYFLLGADNMEHLHTWDEFDTLSSLVEFVFLEREGYPLPPSSHKILNLQNPASSTQIRQGKQKEFLPQFLQGLR